MSSELASSLQPGDSAVRLPGFIPLSLPIRAAFALPLLIACSLALFAINSRHGIGILPDSTRYMGINDRPSDAPLYAWLIRFIALPSFIGIVRSALIVGAALVALNTFLCWRLLLLVTGSTIAALVGTSLLIFSPQFVGLHATAMSEPLFISFIFASLLAFRQWLLNQRREWLVLSSVLVAFCSLVRFSGPPLGAAIALTLLFQPRKSFRTKLGEAALFAIVAASIFFIWLISSEIITGHSTGRELSFDGNVGRHEWLLAAKSFTAWLLPDNVPGAARALVTLLVLGTGFAIAIRNSLVDIARRRGADAAALVTTAILIFVPLYLAFLVLSTEVEANLVINSRYAFPALAATIVLFTCAVTRLLRDTHSTWPIAVALCIALGLLSSDLLRTGLRSVSAYRHGTGFASVQWERSPTIAVIKSLPANAALWSNGPDAISYILGRPAHFIPHRIELRTNKPDPITPYPAQLALMKNDLRSHGGYVVFLDRVDWRFYLGSEQELVRTIGLRMIASTSDGRIYQLSETR